MNGPRDIGVRRFGRVNWLGTYTLIEREIRRFMNVWAQTVMAPLINAGLFLMIFTIAIGPRRGDVMGVPFMEFLAPGILMMTVIQQSFANTSSSMISAKMQGSIIDTLMPPLSAGEILAGYIIGGVIRGLMVGAVIAIGVWLTLGVLPAHPLWLLINVVLGATLMAGLGLIGGIVAQKFDQLSAITNFLVTPLAFLSGTFYSIEALPTLMQQLSHANPIFYMIDGARFGTIGVSDSSPWIGLGINLVAAVLVLTLAWRWLRSGYRLKP